MTTETSIEQELLAEADRVLRAIKDEYFKSGTLTGRTQHEGESLLMRLSSYFQSQVSRG